MLNPSLKDLDLSSEELLEVLSSEVLQAIKACQKINY